MQKYDLSELKRQEPTFLKKAKRSGWVCPVCGNGSGSSGDGITKIPNDPGYHYKCFSGKCGFNGDIIDLYGVYAGVDDPAEKIKACASYYGIDPDELTNKNGQKRTNRPGTSSENTLNDFSTYLSQAEERNDFAYLKGRGISEDTQRHFHIGYDPEWRSPKAPESVPTSPRCIIPRDKTNYLARDTRNDLTDEQKRYQKQNTGRTSLFNVDALKESPVVFVTEGEVDAMSIYEAGANAMALCSAANGSRFIDTLREAGDRSQALVLVLDGDEAGRSAQDRIREKLEEIGRAYVSGELPDGVKDPNEYLTTDPDGFRSWISSLSAEAENAIRDNVGNVYNAGDLLGYFRDIEDQEEAFEAPTGFYELDKDLSGGLHEGLYIIGAISSLGKTTFTLQLADQIAGAGQDVIFFSLEMSKYEIMAKSISRHTYDLKREAKTKSGRYIARDTQQILNNRRYGAYEEEERQVIWDAIDDYEKQAKHIYIYEGRYHGERLTVKHIRDIVKNHIERTGRKPVVFVDYLQIIAPTNPHATDKQNTDTSVFELKEISRDYTIPVFAVSSFNRENYMEPVSMASFKESGAVEYSSDVLFGLQYNGMEYREGDTDKKRKERVRDLFIDIQQKQRNREPVVVDLKCLKQRTGYKFSNSFYMVAAYNHFESFTGKYKLKEWETKTEKKKPL